MDYGYVMPVWGRAALAVGAAVLAWGASFVLIFGSALLFGRCPPEAQVCDLPFIGGFGLAVLVSPLIGLIVAVITFRRTGRPPKVGALVAPPNDR